jgi:hypothetical protein
MPGKRPSLAEREEIAIGLARKEPVRQIAARSWSWPTSARG